MLEDLDIEKMRKVGWQILLMGVAATTFSILKTSPSVVHLSAGIVLSILGLCINYLILRKRPPGRFNPANVLLGVWVFGFFGYTMFFDRANVDLPWRLVQFMGAAWIVQGIVCLTFKLGSK